LSEEAAVVTKKIICLNGPPGSGKDTGAFAILGFCARHAAWMQGTHEKFAEPLKAGVHKLFGMFEGWNRFDNPTHAHLKDEVHRDLFGMTPREAYIWMSEKCVKPLLGEDAFGQMMEHNLRRNPRASFHVISDCGFAPELVPIIRYVGPENVLILELHASGKDFSGDSRGYIGDVVRSIFPDVTCRKVYNEIGDLTDREMFRRMCQGAARKFLDITTDDEE
jgi:hypothetical protein